MLPVGSPRREWMCRLNMSAIMSRPQFVRILTLFVNRNAFSTLRWQQNDRDCADDIFICILLNANVRISIKIFLNFGPKGTLSSLHHAIEMKSQWRLEFIIFNISLECLELTACPKGINYWARILVNVILFAVFLKFCFIEFSWLICPTLLFHISNTMPSNNIYSNNNDILLLLLMITKIIMIMMIMIEILMLTVTPGDVFNKWFSKKKIKIKNKNNDRYGGTLESSFPIRDWPQQHFAYAPTALFVV